jgi:lanthanide-dependent methanol dehydrogenase
MPRMLSLSAKIAGFSWLAALAMTGSLLTAAQKVKPAAESIEWRQPAGDYASTRFSKLDEVNAQTVQKLKVSFTFSTGVLRGHEAAPIVAGNTMFVVTPYPNYLYALDLTMPGAPLKWQFRPNPKAASQGVACCDVVNRGVTYADGRVFFNTLDAQTIAVDARTGKELWRRAMGDINKGETMTMAPLVVKDKVLVGNSGGEYGVRGWVAALDVRTGATKWQAWSTGPDKDVLIGPLFRPYYESDRGQDLGMHSWPGDAWKRGGGTVWGWISYDPDLNLIYHGTANPGPLNGEQRRGDNKWTSGVFARDADTGEARWFYQFNPHDVFDYDGVNENVLLEISSGGKMRKVLVHPDRNGYLYVIDRETGEVLSATAFVHVNTISSVDLKSGRPNYVASRQPIVNKVVREICPHSAGGKDWQPSAYSPQTRLLYIPHQNMCQDQETVQANYIAGTPYLGATLRMYAGVGGHRGVFQAWDPVAQRTVWEVHESFPVWSGALVTAGYLAFYGTMDGWFKALDARTGKVLWQHKVGSGIVAPPITYRGPDGRQYVAVMAGVGGWAGAIVAGDLDARDASAAKGFAQALADLPSRTTKGGTLYVFAIP